MTLKPTYLLLAFLVLGLAYFSNLFGTIAGVIRYIRAGLPDLKGYADDCPWSHIYFYVENRELNTITCIGG